MVRFFMADLSTNQMGITKKKIDKNNITLDAHMEAAYFPWGGGGDMEDGSHDHFFINFFLLLCITRKYIVFI